MIEIARGLIDIAIRYVNWLFFLEIDFNSTIKAPLGFIVISFLFIVFSFYFILKALGFYEGSD